MKTKKCFLGSINPNRSIEDLGEYLAKNTAFGSENAPFWIVCKSIAVSDWQASKQVKVQKGQEFLCVGCKSFYDVLAAFPSKVRAEMVFIDTCLLDGLNYGDMFRDETVEVKGKEYLAKLKV